VTGVFQQAYGLIPGARVLAGGVQVGQVSSTSLGRDGLPRVAMQIDESYHLHQGATAAIEQLSNAGEVNRYVTLSNGTGPSMSDGGVIASTQTDQPVEVDQVLSTLTPRPGPRCGPCSQTSTHPLKGCPPSSAPACITVRLVSRRSHPTWDR